MNGYAPNPQSSEGAGCASLTAGLLARKGEALPAVDADAHAGVDLGLQPMQPANGDPADGSAQGNVNQETIESLYPPVSMKGEATPRSNVHHIQPRIDAAAATAAEEERIFTVEEAKQLLFDRRAREPRPPLSEYKGPKAHVTFRMPARDFVRLRFASRELETSCQNIILEALDCYLDANNIEMISEDACKFEIARLMQKRAQRKGG